MMKLDEARDAVQQIANPIVKALIKSVNKLTGRGAHVIVLIAIEPDEADERPPEFLLCGSVKPPDLVDVVQGLLDKLKKDAH